MNVAYFRFYEELNDFLPHNKRKVFIPYQFTGKPSVKDAIESMGVPHVEIDLILVNGESVGFSYNLENGDKVSVYPVFEALDITPVVRLRNKPLREIKFVLDAHLGKLAKYLRLCGFDCLFDNHFSDPEIINISVKDNRVILTRDRDMLKNKLITHGYWIRSQKNEEQLKEVLVRFDLKNQISLFTRCMICNTPTERVGKEDIKDSLKGRTKRYYSEFWRCRGCSRIYWKGSHYEKMNEFINRIVRELNS